jgi:signal transduction histidine kinase
MKSSGGDYVKVGPRLTLLFVILVAVILGGNGLIIWQFQLLRNQTDRLTGANRQLIAVLQLQASLLSFHQRLEDLARSGDAGRLTAESAPLRQAVRDQVQQARRAIANLPGEIPVDPAFLPILEAIEITLPAQLEAVDELAKSGDWGTVQRRLGYELKPIESQTSVLVQNIDQEAHSELAQASEKMIGLQESTLLIVPATALSTVLIAAVLGWAFARRLLELRLEARVNERTRIARDLHDTLLQSFQGLMLRLQAVDELMPEGKAKDQLEQSLERADQAIAEGRSAVQDLRSSATTTNDLAHALRALGDELATEDSAAFRLVIEGRAKDLHPIIRDELYRIACEALRNAFSHAHARHIEAEITYGERVLRLRVRDDGEGIPDQILKDGRSGHYGLPGIRERARQIGGKLDIWSRAGAGTEIELSIAGSLAYRGSRGLPLFRLFRKTGDGE